MEEIKNEKENVLTGLCMSEEDIINDILICEKNISNNYSTACNEMSNKELYKSILDMLNECKNSARELYNLAFSKGWYSVKTEDENEISKVLNEYQTKLKEIS